jgi:hypothetical protein
LLQQLLRLPFPALQYALSRDSLQHFPAPLGVFDFPLISAMYWILPHRSSGLNCMSDPK